MATVAELEQRLEALREAMDSGVREVDYGNWSMTYRSFDQMRRAEKRLLERIDQANGVTRKRVLRLNTRKGL